MDDKKNEEFGISHGLKEEFYKYYQSEKEIFLTERDQKSGGGIEEYKVTLTGLKNSEIIVIKPSQLLDNSSYIKNRPRNCDYIIFDITGDRIYCIEMKSYGSINSYEVEEQLNSADIWINFIKHLPKNNKKKSTKIIKICIKNITKRNARKITIEKHENNDFFVTNGNRYRIKQFRDL